MTDHHFLNIGRRACFWLLAAVLSACGGGGSGSGATSSAPPPPDGPSQLALTSLNAVQVAESSLGYGAVALGVAQLAVDWALAAEGGTTKSRVGACAGGLGTQTVAWTDKDLDGRVSKGDQLRITLNNCYLRPLEDAFGGTLTIDFTSQAADQSMAGIVSFGTDFGLQNQGVTLRLVGSLLFGHSQTPLSNSVQVGSTADIFGITASNGTVTAGDKVSALQARREVRRDTARTRVTLSYHLASDLLGGSIDVATPIPLGSWFDAYPDEGQVVTTGANSSLVKLYPSPTSVSQFKVDLNAVNVGSTAVASTSSSYLWSGVGFYLPKDQAAPYVLDSARFRLLEAPASQISPKPQVLTWQFSKPLATALVTSARFKPTAVRGNSSWQPTEVTGSVKVNGALLSIEPLEPLVPGTGYDLVFNSGYWLSPVSTTGELATDRVSASFVTTNNVHADIAPAATTTLVGPSAQITIDASHSTSADGSIAAFRWRQVSGPALVIESASSATTRVSPASATNGTAVIEVEVQNARGEADRAQVSLKVLADLSNTLLLGYRADTGPLQIINSAVPAGQRLSVSYFADTRALDVNMSSTRFLTGLPTGTSPAAGLQYAFGAGMGNGATLVWNLGGFGCTSSSGATGQIHIKDYLSNATGTIGRLALDFDILCGNVTYFGSIRYNSELPLRP